MRAAVGFVCAMAAIMPTALGAESFALEPPNEAQQVGSFDCEPYRALLDSLSQESIDLTRDGFAEFDSKNAAARKAVGEFSRIVLDQRFPDEAAAFLVQDYVAFRNATSPRLTGNIVRIGPGAPFADFVAAASQLKEGDLVLFGPGTFQMPDARQLRIQWRDVALIGGGATTTTLKIGRGNSFENAQRLRIEGMQIDCTDDPFIDLRAGGAVHVRNCLVMGYNSGAGGSNAIYSSDATLLIEECVFEGMTGGANRAGSSGGNAFDMRGHNWLYVRQTQFIDNREILRAGFSCVFDGCRALNNTMQQIWNVTPSSRGAILLRDSMRILNSGQGISFDLATDDLEFVQAAAGKSKQVDQRSMQVINALQLTRRLPYWIGLLRHESADVRTVAAAQLSQLIGEKVSAASPVNAKDDGRLDDNSVMLKAELEFARWMQWYEEHKPSLVWDENAGRYQVQKQ